MENSEPREDGGRRERVHHLLYSWCWYRLIYAPINLYWILVRLKAFVDSISL